MKVPIERRCRARDLYAATLQQMDRQGHLAAIVASATGVSGSVKSPRLHRLLTISETHDVVRKRASYLYQDDVLLLTTHAQFELVFVSDLVDARF